MPFKQRATRRTSTLLATSLLLLLSALPSGAARGVAGQGPRVADALAAAASAIDESQFLVTEHYRDFLNREPDPSGLQFWTDNIESCGANAGCRDVKRINTSGAFFLSIEFQQTGYLVYRMHKAAFGNLPGRPVPLTRASFLPDTQAIGSGVVVNQGDWRALLEANKNAFALSFVQRAAFQSAYPSSMSAVDFVNKLDLNAGSVLTAAEKAALVSSLGSTPGDAAKRAAALRSVAEGQVLQRREFNRAFVLMQYFGYLQRDPDDAGFAFWLAKLDQFGGDFVRAEMVKAFLSSQEYRARFVAPQPVTAVIPPGGGKVEQPGFASVTFPSGSFPAARAVGMAATHTAESQSDFQLTSAIFSSGLRLPFEVRVNSGASAPAASFDAVLSVPDSFLKSMPVDAEIKVFAEIYQNEGEEVLDSFEVFESTFDAVKKTVKVTLPKEAFTNARTADASYEAIIVVGTTPTKPNPSSVTLDPTFLGEPSSLDAQIPSQESELSVTAAAAGTCEGSSLGPPLEGTLTSTGAFKPPGHKGTDFRANNDNVLAMADGKIEVVGFDSRKLPRPDPRSGKLIKGWGRFVLIKHTDRSETLYGHLVVDSITPAQVGKVVKKGDIIAKSDNSGGSSAPHLHVEYAPNGKLLNKGKGIKVDPLPCIGTNISGSITVSDNGTLADDAFQVSLDGIVLGTTAIGASNTFAANNIRSGTHTLTILCTVAPDDVGTYEATLAQGITFSGGGTSRSGTLAQGGSVSFPIIAP
jgi:murein DD-endopeptidase MepM/ murein hydrolase activator NlpD